MISGGAACWLRRAEIALAFVGISLLGGAVAAVLDSRIYQARQKRAFSASERGSAAAVEPARQGTPVSAVAAPPTALPADPLVLGLVEIPRLGISAIVREGDDDATLSIAVGHVPGTARPGDERGNVVLAGHRDSFFRELRHVRRGDTVRIRTPEGSYPYLVESTEVVAPETTRVLAPTDDGVLTLVTCYPFGWIGSAPNRFVVRAARAGPESADATARVVLPTERTATDPKETK